MTFSSTLKDKTITDWRKWDDNGALNLHREESFAASGLFSGKDSALIHGIADYSFRPQPIFQGKWLVGKRRRKLDMRLTALLGRMPHTTQSTLYSSDRTLAQSLKDASIGHAVSSDGILKAFANPNKSISSIKSTHAAMVIRGAERAIPVPNYLSDTESLYLFPSGVEFTVEDITTETWLCQRMISCPAVYENILVFHLKVVK